MYLLTDPMSRKSMRKTKKRLTKEKEGGWCAGTTSSPNTYGVVARRSRAEVVNFSGSEVDHEYEEEEKREGEEEDGSWLESAKDYWVKRLSGEVEGDGATGEVLTVQGTIYENDIMKKKSKKKFRPRDMSKKEYLGVYYEL